MGSASGRMLSARGCFVNRTSLSVEVVIIVVIFNKFLTKEAEEAGLCRVWGTESAVLLQWQGACVYSACQCARGETRMAPGWMGGGALGDIYLAHVC